MQHHDPVDTLAKGGEVSRDDQRCAGAGCGKRADRMFFVDQRDGGGLVFVKADAPGIRTAQTGDAMQERRLSGGGPAEDADPFSGRDPEIGSA